MEIILSPGEMDQILTNYICERYGIKKECKISCRLNSHQYVIEFDMEKIEEETKVTATYRESTE